MDEGADGRHRKKRRYMLASAISNKIRHWETGGRGLDNRARLHRRFTSSAWTRVHGNPLVLYARGLPALACWRICAGTARPPLTVPPPEMDGVIPTAACSLLTIVFATAFVGVLFPNPAWLLNGKYAVEPEGCICGVLRRAGVPA